MAKKLLELSTLDPDRPVIEIDGESYECAVPEDFGAVQHTRFERLFRTIRHMQDAADDETDEQAEERALTAETACRKAIAVIIPKLPNETILKLSLSQMLKLLGAYTDFIRPAVTEKVQTESLATSTGETLSPDSNDSMVEALPIG